MYNQLSMTQCFSGNYMSVSVACPGIGKGGGGRKSERFFFCFSLFQGGGGPSSENCRENCRENDISD